jgi:hypothetical protein
VVFARAGFPALPTLCAIATPEANTSAAAIANVVSCFICAPWVEKRSNEHEGTQFRRDA